MIPNLPYQKNIFLTLIYSKKFEPPITKEI